MSAHTAWLAGRVTRWHTNPVMSVHFQTVADHSAGMGILLQQLFPDWTKDELAACITHDLGEMGAGCDMAGDKKLLHPEAAAAIAAVERRELEKLGFTYFGHLERVNFVDRLEAYKFVALREPWYAQTAEWREVWRGLLEASKRLGADLAGVV